VENYTIETKSLKKNIKSSSFKSNYMYLRAAGKSSIEMKSYHVTSLLLLEDKQKACEVTRRSIISIRIEREEKNNG
jgi:hypothetical protein